MKKTFFFLLLVCSGIFSAYSVQQPARMSVKYNPAKHTLSLNIEKAPVSSLIDELAKQDFELFIVNQDTDFSVTGNFNEQPVDEVLAKVIPSKYRYFYRVNDKAATAMLQQKSIPQAATLKQQGNKRMAAKSGLPKLTDAKALVADVKFKAAPKDMTAIIKKDAALERNTPRLKGGEGMTSPKAIQPASVKASAKEKGEVVAKGRAGIGRGGDEHTVVLFKVTKSGMEAVSQTVERGAYNPKNQSLKGDFLVTGSDGSNVVFMQSVENPLESRAIYDPENGSPDHGTFELEENYIAVKMPKKYADATNAPKLKVQLAKVNPAESAEILQKFRTKQLRTTDLSGKVEVIKRAKQLDASIIKLNRNK